MGYQKELNHYQQNSIVFSLVECILQATTDIKICLFINQHRMRKS